jgi:hypothetical protein
MNNSSSEITRESLALGDKPDTQLDPCCWIIQRCTQQLKATTVRGVTVPLMEFEYEDWPGYDTPMTHTEMLAALELCEGLFPEHEFRGHRVR